MNSHSVFAIDAVAIASLWRGEMGRGKTPFISPAYAAFTYAQLDMADLVFSQLTSAIAHHEAVPTER